jgi:KDO2-lipid IV(A) lauroyltransferase
MAKYQQVGVMYRALKNPLLDLVMRNSRRKFCAEVIERSDMRSVVRFLKKDGIMWFAPDQDYGRKQSVFAPFFGIEAATITMLPRLCKINQSAVLILSHHRKPNGKGYLVTISEALSDFPSGDDRQDAATINSELEQRIRQYPLQYMWLHKRFKTRPEGQDSLYS